MQRTYDYRQLPESRSKQFKARYMRLLADLKLLERTKFLSHGEC